MSSSGFCMDSQEQASAHTFVYHVHIEHKCTDEREMSNGRDKTSIDVPKDYAGTRKQGLKREIIFLVQLTKLNETGTDIFISSGLLKFNTDLMNQVKGSG